MDADTLTAEGASDAFLAKYNSSGVLQWSQPFHGNGDWEAIEDMKVKSDGNIFITGRFDYNYIHLSNDSVYSVCNCNTTNVFTAKLAGYANKISGHLFVDFNSNGIKDTADFFVKNEKVTIAPLPGLVFTDTSGYYETFVDTGNFTVTSLYSHPYYYPSPASHIITNNLLNQVYDSLDFALQPTYNITDVSVDVTDMSIPRIYKPQYFRITYTNNGTDTVNGTVSLVLDQQLNFSISVPPTSTINGNTLTWNYFNLNPFETRIINAEANFNILTPLGSIAQVSTSITPFITDTIKTNNSDSLLLTVLSALDPNFKEVSPSANISPDFVQNQNELTYTIHFQNTGNDTAFNISVADTISANLNLNSIRIISSSHTCQLNSNSNSKRAEFIFNNILLPDSNINEPLSHGFVKYAIKPLNSLIVGDSINNTAYIYFDFNAAVITNTCVTKVSEPLSIRGVKTNIETINIYPNPGTGLYHINFSSNTNSLKTVEVFSLLGDKIISFATKNNSVVIDLSKQPQGIYMLRVNDAENTFTGKLIRQ